MALAGYLHDVCIGGVSYVHPQATLDAIVPALLYLAFWYGQAGIAFWLLGFETRGQRIEEIDAALTKPASCPARASKPHYRRDRQRRCRIRPSVTHESR
jgi:hypothetical protein